MESTELHPSPRVRKLYFQALKALSGELNQTWKRVLPGDERWPCGTCGEFFEPFVRFSVALYDAYAEQRLGSTPFPSLEQYLHALNTDLKARVCNEIAPYSPRHGEVQAMVRRMYLDAFSDELNGMQSRLIERIYKEVSLRVPHWLAAHAEIAEGAQAQPERNRGGAKKRPSFRLGYRAEVRRWMREREIRTIPEAAHALAVGFDTLKNIMSSRGGQRYSDDTLKAVLEKIGYKGV